MSHAVAVWPRYSLRCHSCSHAVGDAAAEMRLVGLFRPAAFGALPRSHPAERRVKCRTCGWVNVFHPLTPGAEPRIVEVK